MPGSGSEILQEAQVLYARRERVGGLDLRGQGVQPHGNFVRIDILERADALGEGLRLDGRAVAGVVDTLLHAPEIRLDGGDALLPGAQSRHGLVEDGRRSLRI